MPKLAAPLLPALLSVNFIESDSAVVFVYTPIAAESSVQLY
jgi:hypothetical protein